MVTAMLGEVTNAYFSVVWIMVHTIDLLAVNISASLTVESAIEEQRLAEYARAVARRGFVLFSVLTVCIVLAAPWLLAAFGPEYATQGAVLLRLLAFAVPLKAVAELYAGICRVRRQTGRIAIVKATQCMLLITLSAPLIDRLGAIGVAWAALITHGAVCFALSPAVRRALSARTQSEAVAP
jgi:O-antigen/teichoic acid export membrane protein